MTVRLEGIINGTQIIFSRNDGGWQAAIPPDFRGTYVVELTAYDEAGNEGHTSRYILTFDPTDLKCELQEDPFSTKIRSSLYISSVRINDYSPSLRENEYIANSRMSDYYARLRGGKDVICN